MKTETRPPGSTKVRPRGSTRVRPRGSTKVRPPGSTETETETTGVLTEPGSGQRLGRKRRIWPIAAACAAAAAAAVSVAVIVAQDDGSPARPDAVSLVEGQPSLDARYGFDNMLPRVGEQPSANARYGFDNMLPRVEQQPSANARYGFDNVLPAVGAAGTATYDDLVLAAEQATRLEALRPDLFPPEGHRATSQDLLRAAMYARALGR